MDILCLHYNLKTLQDIFLPTSVPQLDVHPTGDQEVAGLTPAEATFFHGD